MSDVDINQSPFPASPVVPELFEGDKKFTFRCHKDIKCFNACCSNIDISLTPYDIIRLKNRLGMKSDEFLLKYTFPYEMEKDGMAGVKFKPVENGTACQFMVDEGCSVYHGRPWRCRQWPLVPALLEDENNFLIIRDSCPGINKDLSYEEFRDILARLLSDEPRSA